MSTNTINEKIGVFIAVDDKYHGLIPNKEIISRLKYGDTVTARVNQIRRDGKLVLSLRKKAYGEMDGDAARMMAVVLVSVFQFQ